VIAVGHPSEGVSDGCTPSKTATSYQDLALPWAALGYAVIVPDYAGLGTDGIQGYLDNTDSAHSLLDGARALRKLLPARGLSKKIVLFGYSQGGGAALSGQALEKAYGADGLVVGVVAFAPQWPTRLNSFGYVDILDNPSGLTIGSGLSKSVIAVLREYAYFGNHVAGASPTDGFPSAKRDALGQAVDTTCLIPLGGYVQVMEPTLGESHRRYAQDDAPRLHRLERDRMQRARGELSCVLDQERADRRQNRGARADDPRAGRIRLCCPRRKQRARSTSSSRRA